MEVLQWSRRQVRSHFPKRKKDAHKGDFGKILLLCGSVGFTGAASLAAIGALRTGAGLVYLGVPESIYAIEATKLTEPIVFPLPEDDGKLSVRALSEILRKLPAMDAILIGPGLGQSEGTLAVTQAVLEQATCPVVLDADGINVLCSHKDILRERAYPTILTPHAGEFARLAGRIGEDRVQTAVDFAREYGCIMLLKGHGTIITDGTQCYRNPTGNPGMAVGGSGDLLSGILVSLLGQGFSPMDAAVCGAWLHGAAGDFCAKKLGQYGMLPTDMLEVLPRLIK